MAKKTDETEVQVEEVTTPEAAPEAAPVEEAPAPAPENVSVPASVLADLMATVAALKDEVAAAKAANDTTLSQLKSVGLAAREVAAVPRTPTTRELENGIMRTDY